MCTAKLARESPYHELWVSKLPKRSNKKGEGVPLFLSSVSRSAFSGVLVQCHAGLFVPMLLKLRFLSLVCPLEACKRSQRGRLTCPKADGP